jgi:TolB-like protein
MQLSALTAVLGRFLAELQRRKVLRVAAGYVLGACAVLAIAVDVREAWTLPPTFARTILNLLIMGFPVAMVLTWFFELTPGGIKRTSASGDGTSAKFQTTDFILAGALVVVIGAALFLWPRVSSPASETATAAKPETAGVSKPHPPRLGDKSIAVLPFATLSQERADEIFADTLTEELDGRLRRVKLSVGPPTSPRAFKNNNTPLDKIAEGLGVRYLLEGSVRRDGENLHVHAQLIDVIGSSTFQPLDLDRSADTILGATDEIARQIGRYLNVELDISEGVRSASIEHPAKRLAAKRPYLDARERFTRLSRENAHNIIDLFERAVTIDPSFAQAHARLAYVYSTMRWFDPTRWEEYKKKARDSALKAIALDPGLGTPYAALAALARSELDWEGAVDNGQKAADLEPSDSTAQLALGYGQLFVGNLENAAHAFNEAERFEPIYSSGPFQPMIAAFASGDNAMVRTFAAKLRDTKGLSAFLTNLFLASINREAAEHDRAEKFVRSLLSAHTSVIEPVVAAVRSPAARASAVAALKKEAGADPAFDVTSMYFLIGAYDQFADALNAKLVQKDGAFLRQYVFLVWHLVSRGDGANPKIKQLFRNAGLVDYWKKHGWPDRCRAKGEDDFECS